MPKNLFGGGGARSSAKFQRVNRPAMGLIASIRNTLQKPGRAAGSALLNQFKARPQPRPKRQRPR